MKYRYMIWSSLFLLSIFSGFAQQSGWPALVQSNNGASIKVYEPQPESFSDNVMKIRAAISVINSNQQDPVFGVIWADVQMDNSSDNNTLYWKNVSITNIKLPGDISDDQLSQLKSAMETGLPAKNLSISQSQLNSQLSSTRKENELSSSLNTKPPKIIYTKKPSILVTVDGQPQLQQNPDWGVQQVVNTPFTIIKNSDQQYYLYGEKKWYRAADVTGPYTYVNQLPSSLSKINDEIQANDTSKGNYLDYTVPDVLVSTEPAELIQSNGDANFSPVEGTNLLYMTNTVNDIFLDVNSQQYYVLVSGRWYKSPNLNSNWTYVSSSSLPQDFAKIPEGSSKDAVLANVAGTNAANDAIADAQLPQTAKVDRRNATANVTYDGEPQFESISGTHLKYAVNTPGTVLNLGRNYYSVENGVWFESGSPYGPWTVATSRPAEVENIPPSYPVYNTKYVYVYDVTPDYVYMGYTPGYLGTYVYGPSIFYGTGYYYHPWRGHYYYPRPVTWGYNMRYNPYYGWGFGVNLNLGWFNIGIGRRYSDPFWGWRGGWFGPSVYYPSYYRPFNNYYGSRGNIYAGNYYRPYSYSNIYNNRRGVVTYERPMYAYNRNIARPSGSNNGRYYNPNGYNNTNRARPGGYNTGRASDPVNTPGRPSGMNGNRYGGQQNNGINNRFPGNNGNGNNGMGNNNRFPGSNGGINNRQPGNTTPSDNRNPGNNYNGNRYGNNNGTGNGNGNSLPDNRSPRQYQPQTQPQQPQQNRGDMNRNPAASGGNGFDRSQRPSIERNNAPEQRNPVQTQPQMRDRQANPGGGFNGGGQRPQIERAPRTESNSGRGNTGGGGFSGGGNSGGRSQGGGGERGSSHRRGG